MSKPTDAAIAAAFWELHAATRNHFAHSGKRIAADGIYERAVEIDEATKAPESPAAAD